MSVDMFGFDEFGNPAGMSPIWGALIGPGLQSGGAIAWRAFTTYDKWAEAIGAALGAVAGGVMMIFEPTRGAGTVALASALATGVPRQVEQLVSKTEDAKAAAKKALDSVTDPAVKAAMLKALTAQGLAGLGMQALETRQRGLGAQAIEYTKALQGAPGLVAGVGGLAQNPAVAQLRALGGPTASISGLGGRYGATVLG